MGAALLLDLGNHQLKVGRSSSEEACEFLPESVLFGLKFDPGSKVICRFGNLIQMISA